MRVRWVILTALLLAAFLNAEQGLSQEGKEFAPKNGMFTITLPAGEKSSQRKQVLTLGRSASGTPSAAGRRGQRRGRGPARSGGTQSELKVPVEGSESVLKDGSRFLGASIGIPAVVMREIPADQRFDIFRDALVKHLKGKLGEEKDIKQDPVPGKEYQIQLPKGAARMQIYTIAGFVVYGIVEGPTKESVNGKQADEFFHSLKLTDKAKDVFRRVKR